jgi:hypothetical protein
VGSPLNFWRKGSGFLFNSDLFRPIFEVIFKFHFRVFGSVALGTVDEKNVVHLLPKINGKHQTWATIRNQSLFSESNRKTKTFQLDTSDTSSITADGSDLDLLRRETRRWNKSRLSLVLLAVPPAGPSILLPIGHMDSRGQGWDSPKLINVAAW